MVNDEVAGGMLATVEVKGTTRRLLEARAMRYAGPLLIFLPCICSLLTEPRAKFRSDERGLPRQPEARAREDGRRETADGGHVLRGS